MPKVIEKMNLLLNMTLNVNFAKFIVFVILIKITQKPVTAVRLSLVFKLLV